MKKLIELTEVNFHLFKDQIEKEPTISEGKFYWYAKGITVFTNIKKKK